MKKEHTHKANFINGQWVSSAHVVSVNSPRTGQLFAFVPDGTKLEIDAAVGAAKAALPGWSSLTIEQRCATVRRMADWLKEQYGDSGEATELKQHIMYAIGKPLPEADIEVIESASFIDYFCDIAPSVLAPENISLSHDLWPTKQSSVSFEPVGIVGIIKPWNYPLEMPIWSMIPALLAGNTVVFKPSERASTIGLLFGEMALSANLPNGVLNIVAGGKDLGKYLVDHHDVNMISFTGSNEAGRWIAESCGRQLKKVSLELGGNDAAIVLEDANIELVANGLTWGAFCNAGQVCVGIKKVLVSEKILGQVLPRIVENAEKLRLGIDIGPLVDQRQLDDVQNFVEDAIAKGAKVLVGGKPRLQDGQTYFEPTVLLNVTTEMKIANEECFGPVMPIMTFGSVSEAISVANSSDYGLGASIWTENEESALSISKELKVGMVWINDVNVAFSEAPWGGVKKSGLGFELSPDSIREYAVRKHLNVEKSKDVTRAWWYPYGE